MDAFDDDTSTLASAMTYNELGLVKNSYDGAYGYGDTVGYIDMNDEGVAMLEDNIFCTKEFAAQNPETVKAFLTLPLKDGSMRQNIPMKRLRLFMRQVLPYPRIIRNIWPAKWQNLLKPI